MLIEIRENPGKIIVVMGCSSQNNQEKYQALGVDILIGNKEKSKIGEILEEYLKTHKKYEYFTKERNLEFEEMKVLKFNSHTRAFLKIQDGCNNFCSYCIIPYTRGNIRSKSFTKAIEEAKILVANGHQEIVLTGIHTGSYNDNGKDLSDLIKELAKIPELKRIRISSIEITELNEKFMQLLREESKICDHLHIPLQSGSDKVLKKMNRKYDTAYYRNKIKEIREIRKDISITTDAIVGHPYESDEDFLEYMDFCKEMKFSKIHVFPYSIRNGTAASKMPQVDGNIKKLRAKKLIELSDILEKEYASKFIGKEVEVLTEEYEGEYTVGHTSNYLKVYLKGEYKLNTFYKCQIKKIVNNKIYGEEVSCINLEVSL